jgi:hypothetical protein
VLKIHESPSFSYTKLAQAGNLQEEARSTTSIRVGATVCLSHGTLLEVTRSLFASVNRRFPIRKRVHCFFIGSFQTRTLTRRHRRSYGTKAALSLHQKLKHIGDQGLSINDIDSRRSFAFSSHCWQNLLCRQNSWRFFALVAHRSTLVSARIERNATHFLLYAARSSRGARHMSCTRAWDVLSTRRKTSTLISQFGAPRAHHSLNNNRLVCHLHTSIVAMRCTILRSSVG